MIVFNDMKIKDLIAVLCYIYCGEVQIPKIQFNGFVKTLKIFQIKGSEGNIVPKTCNARQANMTNVDASNINVTNSNILVTKIDVQNNGHGTMNDFPSTARMENCNAQMRATFAKTSGPYVPIQPRMPNTLVPPEPMIIIRPLQHKPKEVVIQNPGPQRTSQPSSYETEMFEIILDSECPNAVAVPNSELESVCHSSESAVSVINGNVEDSQEKVLEPKQHQQFDNSAKSNKDELPRARSKRLSKPPAFLDEFEVSRISEAGKESIEKKSIKMRRKTIAK